MSEISSIVMETPAQAPLRERLPVPQRNKLQMELIEEFRMDPMKWIEKYAASFDEITMNSKKLRALVVRDPEAAVDIVYRRLIEKTPADMRRYRRAA